MSEIGQQVAENARRRAEEADRRNQEAAQQAAGQFAMEAAQVAVA
ncbi:MAG TPA: hypothetical protein VGO07_04565 [Candidatus Saccharimonadales bacterium]|jgi:hypothetical protein|nr:hypothetical protein [Candidatus Saccharimonadales bacterium]